MQPNPKVARQWAPPGEKPAHRNARSLAPCRRMTHWRVVVGMEGREGADWLRTRSHWGLRSCKLWPGRRRVGPQAALKGATRNRTSQSRLILFHLFTQAAGASTLVAQKEMRVRKIPSKRLLPVKTSGQMACSLNAFIFNLPAHYRLSDCQFPPAQRPQSILSLPSPTPAR
jgi:hypothetical protein